MTALFSDSILYSLSQFIKFMRFASLLALPLANPTAPTPPPPPLAGLPGDANSISRLGEPLWCAAGTVAKGSSAYESGAVAPCARRPPYVVLVGEALGGAATAAG